MAKLPILLLLAAVVPVLPARGAASHAPGAAGRVTIDQLEQLLPALRAERDARAASKLAALELTERATAGWLARWQAKLPGERARKALLALADASAFLDLPVAETSNAAAPSIDTQRQILSRAVDYVNKILRKLPDFSALRTTTRFEVATPAQLVRQRNLSAIYQMNAAMPSFRALGRVKSAQSYPTQLYFAGILDSIVTYRDGGEVEETQSGKSRHSHPPPGLSTRGEFGPILYVVLGDAVRGKVTWSHWEQGPMALLAVFHYEVPKEISHYALESTAGERRDFPAYHGEIAVDPASGAIFRITIQSVPNPSAWLASSAALVEYGLVVIGGSTYICPVHGVAISQARDFDPQASPQTSSQTSPESSIPLQTYLNDVSFTHYHVFRAETRILPAGSSVH